MGRLTRFDGHRYIGTRDTMHVYDCDDPTHFEQLQRRAESHDLFASNLLQTFGPDSAEEAANRGFRPFTTSG